MKTILVEKPFEIKIAEVEKPAIENKDDVLIKIISGGICGSDIGIFNGSNSLATYPRIIGHEYGGQVVEVGDGVTDLIVGDKVAIDPVRSCGECFACKNGRHNVCSTLEVTGVHRDGGFAEYIVVPAANAYKIDTSKVPEELISLVEPYSIGAQINARGEIKKGDKVLIMGSGPIGVCTMQIAKARGAEVVITDIVTSRLERAKEMGADIVVNVLEEDLSKVIMDFTNNEGMPVVIDSVCSVESFEQSVGMASPAGRVVVIGLLSKKSAIAQVEITKKELNIIGSRLSNYRFPEVIEGFESGVLTPEKLRTHSFHYTEVVKAFELIKEHPEQVCKVTLRFD
ncbi:zinc-binding alcohol dehydrogenase family protein [Alkalibacter saccharofermentans]|uniref:L-gulonate 5-dehydrogenase n=1 Tax=Alkalibacter saccharofermentans DSM 14828 TaxID=1120975 RepID=A0A1M5A6I3_9FIRM|nr:zinc-binding alcohol dehydrogenase family protein [Alkalibacter saccharofermentans]SHF25913.1 L-gulonate 5-dehydrogenase [Alkalibacter saccharofermentans DSM 14828]